MVTLALKYIVLISSILYVNGQPLDLIDMKAFPIYCAVLLFAVSFCKSIRISIPKQLSYIIFISICNLFLSHFNNIVMSSFINLIYAIIFISLIFLFCDDWDEIFKFAIYGGLINIIIMLMQRVGFSPFIQIEQNVFIGEQSGGIFGNFARLGMYLSLCVPMAYKLKNYLIFFVLTIISIYLMEMLPLFAVAVCVLHMANESKYRKSSVLTVSLGITIALALVMPKIIHSLHVRWLVWEPTIEQFAQSFWKGYGLGIFPYVSNQFVDTLGLATGINVHAENAFSSVLQFCFAVGIFGLFPLIQSINILNRKFDIVYIFTSIMVVLSIFEYPFEVPKMWTILCIIIAYILANQKEALCQ